MVTFKQADQIIKGRVFLTQQKDLLLISEDRITWTDISQNTEEEVREIMGSEFNGVDVKREAGCIF